MKAELRQKWLDKLRSGEIQQAKNVLRDESNAMCCLGVLLDIASPKGWEARPGRCYTHYRATSDHGMIASSARAAFGFDESVEYDAVDEKGQQRRLSAPYYLALMNDQGKSFAEIADWIEANIPADAA